MGRDICARGSDVAFVVAGTVIAGRACICQGEGKERDDSESKGLHSEWTVDKYVCTKA